MKASTAANKIAEMIASECALRDTRMLNRRVSQWYDDALRAIGLGGPQLTLLVVVGKNGPLTATELAHRLAMEKSTLSRNANRLLEKGWLETMDTEDGRSQMLVLSREGGKILVKAFPLWTKAQKQVQEAIGIAGMEHLHRISHDAMK